MNAFYFNSRSKPGCKTQEQMCYNYAQGRFSDGDIFLKYEDADTEDRPAFDCLVEHIQNGLISTIIIYHSDCLGGDLLEKARFVDMLRKQQVNFVSVAEHIYF